MTPVRAGIAMLGFVLAVAAGPPVPALAADEGATVLHLTQTAERAVRRDRVRAQLRAEATADDARQLQGQINRLMSAALERAKAVPGIQAETSGYSVFEEPRGGTMASRWHGSQELTLSGADVGNVLSLVGDLQSSGLVMSNLGFYLAPETARGIEDELTSEALMRLRQRAERVAGDLQLKLMRLRDVRVGNVDGTPPPRPEMRLRAVPLGGAPAALPPPAAEAGNATVQISVAAEFVLGEGDHAP